jgi:hypothetical protein
MVLQIIFMGLITLRCNAPIDLEATMKSSSWKMDVDQVRYP